MDHFSYKRGVLHAEGLSLATLADKVGTPFYCYSSATLTHHVEVLKEALAPLSPMICFAVKSNPNRAVLRTLHDAGCGADVVSEGEIRAAIAAGISPKQIIFSGVGKTRDELAYALKQNIFQFNVESAPELHALSEIASAMGKTARIAIRVNPDVDAETHAKISTGKKENKFGVAIDAAPKLYGEASTLPGISVVGVSMHIGSQLTSLAPFEAAYIRAKTLVLELRTHGHDITTLDIGGGLGVPYFEGANPPSPAEYGALVKRIFGDLNCRLILEPGRLIAGNAGILVTRVIYVKQGENRTYVIVDAAMNDLMRPALYDAFHAIIPVRETDAEPQEVDIVGPVCETGDTFATCRPLPLPKEGDLLAFRTTGAYGASMSHTYNMRPLILEMIVQGKEYAITRPRQSYDDLIARTQLADWQK
jgi:diaminopimelate decarboxylase